MSSSPSLLLHQTIQAPGKLNLFLKFVGRRSDGYHLLSMWNVLTTLYDELIIDIFEDTTPTVRVEVVGAPELSTTPNIVAKAALAWLQLNNKCWSVYCRLHKNIPIGAGMGGGSSDAAAMLLTLERFGGPSRPGELKRIALLLGADVPYFLQGGATWVGGIGEVIYPIAVVGLDGRPCVIVMPSVTLSTKSMYDAVRQRFPNLPEYVECSPALPPATFFEMQALLENDFEAIAMSISPEVAEVLTVLRSDASLAVHMTGSGAALFVLSRENDTLEELDKKVLAKLSRGGVADATTRFLVRLVA
jgi:4-diphosphocytidyl-2-C-methyl-D-erythritol kinase